MKTLLIEPVSIFQCMVVLTTISNLNTAKVFLYSFLEISDTSSFLKMFDDYQCIFKIFFSFSITVYIQYYFVLVSYV